MSTRTEANWEVIYMYTQTEANWEVIYVNMQTEAHGEIVYINSEHKQTVKSFTCTQHKQTIPFTYNANRSRRGESFTCTSKHK